MTLHVVTANVNGIRAALRRGGLDWLAGCGADVLCLQEVRATADQVAEALGAGGLGDWHLASASGARSGHAGVALLSRAPLAEVRVGVGGRSSPTRAAGWRPASPTPKAGTRPRGQRLRAHRRGGGPPARGEGPVPRRDGRLDGRARRRARAGVRRPQRRPHAADIKNWRGNRGKAGFLESERAHLDRWYAPPPEGLGWVDLGRRFGGDGRVPTPGGRGGAAASTPMAAGGSTSCWRPRPWPRERPGSSCTRRPATPSAGATTPRCRPRSTDSARAAVDSDHQTVGIDSGVDGVGMAGVAPDRADPARRA